MYLLWVQIHVSCDIFDTIFTTVSLKGQTPLSVNTELNCSKGFVLE